MYCVFIIYTGSRIKKWIKKMATEWKNYAPAQTSEKRTTLSMAPLVIKCIHCKQREVDSSDEVDSRQYSVFTYLKKLRLYEPLRFLSLSVPWHSTYKLVYWGNNEFITINASLWVLKPPMVNPPVVKPPQWWNHLWWNHLWWNLRWWNSYNPDKVIKEKNGW